MSKLVVLGCGGFVGSHLLDRLFCIRPTEFSEIYGWDVSPQKIEPHVGRPDFVFRERSISDQQSVPLLTRDIAEADVVINLAAICNPALYNTQPYRVIHSNFIDAYKIVEICAAYDTRLIHFSTSEVYGRTLASYLSDTNYGDPDLYELEEDQTPLIMGPLRNQRWSYACAKQLLERLILACHHEKGLTFTIVRPLNFFGPRMDFIPGRDGEGVPRVLACFVSALLDRKPMLLVDGGKARRTVVAIQDAIDALIRILQRPESASNQVFNIGNRANEVSIRELAEMMRIVYAEISGDASYRDHPFRTVSSAEFYGDGYEDCDRRMPRLDKAKELLGWEPKIPLIETLKETVSYYHSLYGVSRITEAA